MASIITHRGLNQDKDCFYAESSLQAFKAFLDAGYGLEFDINFLSDNKIAIFHDINLSRITNKSDNRDLNSISYQEFMQISVDNCKFTDLEALLQMIDGSVAAIHALHYKGKLQNYDNTQELIKVLKKFSSCHKKIIIFDLKHETAKQIKESIPGVELACSVSSAYDIQRFNHYVSNTLLSIEQACQYRELFSWAWLDEWDTLQEDGTSEYFYSEQTFCRLRQFDFKIALVSPELHATSPGLYAAESHPDAVNKESLFTRIKQILSLNPDAICTDYPESLSQLVKAMNQ